MSATFIDTSFLLALLIADDAMHDKAVALQTTTTGALLTTEYVLAELLDALTSGPMRTVALQAVDLLRADQNVQVVEASPILFNAGVRLFRDRPDKQWGLTDCISFIVMDEAKSSDALTADRHFEQAGFRALPRQML